MIDLENIIRTDGTMYEVPSWERPTYWQEHGDAWLRFGACVALAVGSACAGFIVGLWIFMP